jgi:hypothetical protein
VPASGVLVPYAKGEAMRPHEEAKAKKGGIKAFRGDIKNFGKRIINS